jgi:SPP1 family predicted phage head-tail adaptor
MVDSTLPAGDLDRRVTLLSPVYNGDSDEIDSYQLAGLAWAAVEPIMGAESTEADREMTALLVNVTLRYRADIDARWRIQDGEHTYEIQGIADVARRRVQLKLNCQEIQ